jgi:hypothetical protein
VEIELVTRRVQTRLERIRTGPEEWLAVTRCLLADEGTVEGQASPDAHDQDARYGYRYYLTPDVCGAQSTEGTVVGGTGAHHHSGNMH